MIKLYVKSCLRNLSNYIFVEVALKNLSQQVVFLQAYDELMPKLCEKFSWKLCSKLPFCKEAEKSYVYNLYPPS